MKKISSLMLIGALLTLTVSCVNSTSKDKPPTKPENAAQKPASAPPPVSTPAREKPAGPPSEPVTEKLEDVSHLLTITNAFALEHLGFWGENFTVKGMPMISGNGEHMLRLQFKVFETAFAPSGEEAEPIGEFVIEKVKLSDLSVAQAFPLLSKKEILQAHRDARQKACVDKNQGTGEDEASGVADCPVDEKQAATVVAATRKSILKQAMLVAAELKTGQYTSMKTVALKDPPAGEDGEEAEPPKNPDPELVYTVKVTKHRPTVRVLRKRDAKVLGEMTLQCTALPETSCTLGDYLELFSDSKGTKVVVTSREVDMENGEVLASVVLVLPLKTVP